VSANEPRDAAFDVTALGSAMIDAARGAVAERWPALQALAELELRRLAGALADIGSLLAKREIDLRRAQTLVQIHKLSVRSVLRSVEGLSLVAAEQTLDAIVLAGAAIVNRAVGLKLL